MSYSETETDSSYWGSCSTIIDVNTVKSIIAVIFIAVIGPCVFIVQPAFVQGLIEYLQYSDEQAGLIASAEMFGVATTAIIVNFVLNRFNWRVLIAGFLTVAAIGNFLSLLMTDASSLMIMRFITGLGSGGLMVFSFTMLGITARADRNMGYMLVALLSYGALGLLIMPTAYIWVGMEGVLVFFGLFCLSGLFFVAKLPCSHQAHELEKSHSPYYPPLAKVITLSGVLLYNVAIGLVWVYMFVVGVEAGIPEQTVANGLMLSQFFGIAGAFMAVLFENRYGRLLPLTVGIIGGAAGIALLLDVPSAIGYIVAVCMFNGLWNLSVPYLMALLSDFDSQGRMVTLGVTLQLIGFAIGPALAAALLDIGGFDLINSLAIGLFVVAGALLIPGIRAQKSNTPHAVSAASLG